MRSRLIHLVLAALPIALFLGLSGCSIVRHGPEAARFLREVGAGQGQPTSARLPSKSPGQAISYATDGRRRTADLYLPPDRPPEAGVVLVAGLAELGYRDPRLVAFARSLAKAKFAVLVPDIPNLRRLKIGEADADRIGDAFRFLISRPDLAPQGRAGMAAASYAVAPAIIAALHPSIRGHVRFIVGVAGHYDPEDVMTFAVTGYYRDRAEPRPRWRRKKPDDYSIWSFLARNLDFTASPRDRELLNEVAQRRLRQFNAPIGDLEAKLGKQGRIYLELLTAKRPEQVADSIARMPPSAQRQISATDLARHDLSKLQAELILVHGRNDQLIPYTESTALAAAVPKAKVFLIESLAHVDFGKLSLADSVQLMRAASELFDHRSARTVPGR